MDKCPQCGFERIEASPDECAKCGILFEKWFLDETEIEEFIRNTPFTGYQKIKK